MLNLCERWPNAPLAPEFGPGPLPDVPVLLLEGEDDLRTPVENAQRVGAQFPQSSLVVAPATGHSVLGNDFSGCTDRAFRSFFRGPAGRHALPRTRRFFQPTPPPPRQLSDVSPFGGTGRPGRTLAAVRLTLVDVAEDSVTELIFDLDDPDRARGGGLRAGHYRIDGDNALTLDGVAFVPGVTVSGRLEHFGERRQRGRLRVSGGAAARGVLRLRGGRVRGVLGGRPVRAGLYARGAIRALAAQRQHRRAIERPLMATATSFFALCQTKLVAPAGSGPPSMLLFRPIRGRPAARALPHPPRTRRSRPRRAAAGRRRAPAPGPRPPRR